MSSYKKPGKINVVSVLIFLALAAAAYAGVRFGPPYYRKWKVKSVLDETTVEYIARRARGASFAKQLEEKAERKISALGVADPGLRVQIYDRDREVTTTCSYRVVINHPFVNKATTLNFNLQVTRSTR